MIESKEQQVDLIALAMRCIDFCKRRFWLLLVISVVGLMGGTADYYLSEKVYSTDFVVTSPVVDSRIVSALSQPLIYYVNSNNSDSIASLMNISISVTQNMRKIAQDTSIPHVVIINVQYCNPEIRDSIKNGLVYFYNHISFVEKSVASQKADIADYITIIEAEIAELNRIQKLELMALEEGKGSLIEASGNSFDEIILLYDKLHELKKEYNGLKPFSVINQSLVATQQTSLTKSVIVYGLLGLILGFLVAIIAELLRHIKRSKSTE